MRWTPTPSREPAIGATRKVLRFALFPVTLRDGRRLWLERYYAFQTYGWTNADDDFVFGWHTASRMPYSL